MTRGFDVVYFFEHAARELDVACAVTHLLRQRGLRATVVQWPHGFHRVASLPAPKVVVLPFCYTQASFSTCLLEWRTATYFNAAWEQLFYAGNEKAKSPRGAFATRHVIHHAWGDFTADILRRHGVPSDRIFVNGHPAYQLYELPYASYFPDRAAIAERFGLSADKRWVFFPENYNWAFYTPETLRRFIMAGQRADDVEAMRVFCEESLREVLAWCVQLADRQDVELIIRPRPATPASEFRSYVERVIGRVPERMRILQDGTVREWIRAADVVVSSHSTSLIEASIAGKPAYMLAPRSMPQILAVDWHAKAPKIRSQSELVRAAFDADAADSLPLVEWARSRVMAHGDAIRNLANHLATMVRGDVPLPGPVSRADAVEVRKVGPFSIPRALLYELRRFRHRGHRRRPSAVVEPEYVPDLAGEREVEARIARWADILAGTQEEREAVGVQARQ